MSKPYLKLELGRYHNLVFGRVIEQEGIARGNFRFTHKSFNIISLTQAELSPHTLYVHGQAVGHNGQAFSAQLDSPGGAHDLIDRIKSAVHALNTQGEAVVTSATVTVEVVE